MNISNKSYNELNRIRELAQDLVDALENSPFVTERLFNTLCLKPLKRALNNYGNDGAPVVEDERDNLARVNDECAAEGAAAGAPVADDSLQSRLGELGNQLHNVACELQRNEELAARLGELAGTLWELAYPKLPENTQTAQSTTVEDAPVKMLLDLLLSEQMPPQRFVEEMYRRAASDGTAFVLFKI